MSRCDVVLGTVYCARYSVNHLLYRYICRHVDFATLLHKAFTEQKVASGWTNYITERTVFVWNLAKCGRSAYSYSQQIVREDR